MQILWIHKSLTLSLYRAGDYKLIDGYPGLYPDWYKPDQVYDFGPEPSVKDMQAHAGRYQLYNLKGDMIEKFFSLDEMKTILSFTYYIA